MRFRFTGLIPVDKPAGISSRRVVDAVAKALAMKAVGHAGTLDPIASGVVIVCVGHATKLVDFLHQLPKRYVGRFLLGRSSPSDDIELPVALEPDPRRPDADELEHACSGLRGHVLQRPCDFSAVHVAGQRAYDLARRGRAVDLAAKPVTIHELRVQAYDWPRLMLDVSCSTGTYIRAIGRDLAAALGTSAVMDGLVRTSVGPFEQAAALPLDAITPDTAAASLRPALEAVSHLPRAVLDEPLIGQLQRGRIMPARVVPATVGASQQPPAEAVAAVDPSGELVAILRPHPQGWRPRPNFLGLS